MSTNGTCGSSSAENEDAEPFVKHQRAARARLSPAPPPSGRGRAIHRPHRPPAGAGPRSRPHRPSGTGLAALQPGQGHSRPHRPSGQGRAVEPGRAGGGAGASPMASPREFRSGRPGAHAWVLLFPEPRFPTPTAPQEPRPASCPGAKLPAVLGGASQAGPSSAHPPARTGARPLTPQGAWGQSRVWRTHSQGPGVCCPPGVSSRPRGDRLGGVAVGHKGGEAQTRAESASVVQVRMFMWTPWGTYRGACSERPSNWPSSCPGGSQMVQKLLLL